MSRNTDVYQRNSVVAGLNILFLGATFYIYSSFKNAFGGKYYIYIYIYIYIIYIKYICDVDIEDLFGNAYFIPSPNESKQVILK